MKLIKPNFISAEILTLLEEAEERVIIVSPYCNFEGWDKLISKINILKKRNIDIEFYTRQGVIDTYNQVYSLGIPPIEVKDLHCKIYLNENYGIVSSMNLLFYSEVNSLEIA